MPVEFVTRTVEIPDNEAIGASCRKTRRGEGLTLEQLSEKLGMSTSHLSALEQGKRRWSEGLVKRLNRVLQPVETGRGDPDAG